MLSWSDSGKNGQAFSICVEEEKRDCHTHQKKSVTSHSHLTLSPQQIERFAYEKTSTKCIMRCIYK